MQKDTDTNTSFHETLCLLALELGANEESKRIVHMAANEDTLALIGILINWAKEFEEIHAKTKWGEKLEFYEEIESFMKYKIAMIEL